MRVRLFGTEIYISFLFCALITIMLATDRTGLALPTLFSVFVHEIGHLFAMWVLDCEPKSIRLIPASIQVTKSITNKYTGDIWIALSGPIINFVLFGSLYFNYLTFKNPNTQIWALINLIIALFNLLPVNGLDGGTILFSLIAKSGDINRANLAVKIITLILASAFLIFAITLAFRGKVNITFFIVAIYLFVGVLIKM